MTILKTLIIILLMGLSSLAYCQYNKVEIDTSYQVVFINGDTLDGHYSQYDFQTFTFVQCRKLVYAENRGRYPIPLKSGERPNDRVRKTHYSIKVSGAFTDGKPSGKWYYWGGNFDPTSHCNSSFLMEFVNYGEDSSNVEERREETIRNYLMHR